MEKFQRMTGEVRDVGIRRELGYCVATMYEITQPMRPRNAKARAMGINIVHCHFLCLRCRVMGMASIIIPQQNSCQVETRLFETFRLLFRSGNMHFIKDRRMPSPAFWATWKLSLLVLALIWLVTGWKPAHAETKASVPSGQSARLLREPVTFTRNIAPIIFQNCSFCHHSGEVAPFPLLTCRDVQKRARQIAMVTQSRAMPPWRPEHGYGEFQHERRLTQTQIALFRQWADEGAPEGAVADLPPAPQFTDGWELGKPDLIIRMIKPCTIPADGQDVNRSFPVSVHLPAGRYIRAAQFLPGNRRIVHHGTVLLDSSGRARQLEDQQGGLGSGYVSFGGPGFLPSAGLPGYAPGFGAEVYPPDASGTLPKDVDVVFGMHYHPDGKVETDQSSIGLYFTDKPPTRIGSLVTMGVLKLAIAPGDKAHLEQDSYILPVDVDVDSIYEHMHLLGKTCKLWAELPDHSVRPLIKINDWDFSWQSPYHLKNRLHLPKGTVIHAEWTYDNSADNPHQFNDPPKLITDGENSTNEMGGVLINVYVASPQDNGILWIANLGHLWQASVKPPAHPASHQAHALTSVRGQKASVLLFIASDCPISNSYAPEINRICARYTREKIAFTLVYSDPDLSLDAAKKHARDYGFTCPLVLDPSRHMAHKAGVTVTPEAAVFAPNGKMLYRGRIDNLYVGFGQRRFRATQNDLRDALDAIVQGKPISSPRTIAIGCFI